MTDPQQHPLATPHLPSFITSPGSTDWLFVFSTILFIAAVLLMGSFYLRLHSLPERMMHRTQKLQFEIVAVLGLISLLTHNHLFWIAGLLLAFIDLPDFSTPLGRIAGSLEKMADIEPDESQPQPTKLDIDAAHHSAHAAEAESKP